MALQLKAAQQTVIEEAIFGTSTSTPSIKRPSSLDGFVTAFKTPKWEDSVLYSIDYVFPLIYSYLIQFVFNQLTFIVYFPTDS